MRKDIIIIKDPQIAKLFADETRRQILHNLGHHELSTTDLAKILHKNHSSILHHLKLLQNAGLVEKTRVKKRGNLFKTYYISTAHRFIISYSLSESLEVPELISWQKEMINKMVEGLSAFGIDVPDAEKNNIRELAEACFVREQRALEETVQQQVMPFKFEKPVYAALIKLLTQVKLAQDNEHVDKINKLGKLLIAKKIVTRE